MTLVGEISLGGIAQEFCVRPPINISQMYRGTDPVTAFVLSNGGSNDKVPLSGPIALTSFRGASCTKTTNNMLLTFQADFSALSGNATIMSKFQKDVRTSVADAGGVPVSSVTIVSVTAGSVKVSVDVGYPVQSKVTAATLSKLAALISDPTATFGPTFNSQYSISGQLSVVDLTPPLLLSAAKALPNVAGSTTSVSVADLFAAASNTGSALTYAVASTTSPLPSSLSMDSNTGMLSVQGRYRNTSYTVDVRAMSLNGVPSSNATVAITELDAPLPTLVSSLGSATLSNNTVTYGMSNYFTTPPDTLPLYFYMTANPKANASIAQGGVLNVLGTNRGESYNVMVSASNAYGKVAAAPQTLAVTEAGNASQGTAGVYPPVGLANFTQNGTLDYNATVSGQSIGNGTYNITGSSQFDTAFGLVYAFDASASFWASIANSYNTTTGACVSGKTTIVAGSTYTGEYITLKLPVSIHLSSYTITPSSSAFPGSAPKTWIVAGSTDGSLWSLVDYRSAAYTWANTNPVAFPVSTAQSFNYYRFIIVTNGAGSHWAGFNTLQFTSDGA